MISRQTQAPVAQHDWRNANLAYLALRLEDLKARLRFAPEGRPSPKGGVGDLDVGIRRQRDAAVAAGRPPALELLSVLFGLTPVEQDVLLMSLAPDVDDSFTGIFASTGDPRRRRATLSLVLTLHRDDAGGLSHLDCLLPVRALRRFALVWSLATPDHSAWSIGAPLYTDERIAVYLRGMNVREPRLVQIARPLSGGLEAPAHAGAIAAITQDLSPGAHEWPIVRIASASYADAREAAQAAARRADMTIAALDLAQLAERRADWEELFAMLARESALNRTAYWLESGDGAVPDPAVRATGEHVMHQLEAPLLFFAGASFGSEGPARTVILPRLDRRAQKQVWQTALAASPNAVNGALDRIAQQFDLGPSDIARVISLAGAHALSRASGAADAIVSGDDLWAACREQSAMHLDDLARRIEPCFVWEDIVVPPPVMSQLREIASQVNQRGRVYEAWGFGEKLGRGRGISVLFSGASGTGKTMAAEVIARHLNLDLYRIDLSGVINKYIGETEKNLRRVFDAAEKSGAILFFDEADALFGTRTEVRDSHDRYANIEVNYLLQRMEDYSGLAILATNRKQALDQAFLRRLRFVVDFPFPDVEHRRWIWQRVFPTAARKDALDYNALARLEVPGGNIRAIALNAAFLAAEDDAPITTLHVMRAAGREFAKIERAVSAAEFGPYAEAARR
jgi:ATPase family protein associated with various cellular activities (AAA)/winged helix domain-containing protein